jgi:hypothetical protein
MTRQSLSAVNHLWVNHLRSGCIRITRISGCSQSILILNKRVIKERLSILIHILLIFNNLWIRVRVLVTHKMLKFIVLIHLVNELIISLFHQIWIHLLNLFFPSFINISFFIKLPIWVLSHHILLIPRELRLLRS